MNILYCNMRKLKLKNITMHSKNKWFHLHVHFSFHYSKDPRSIMATSLAQLLFADSFKKDP